MVDLMEDHMGHQHHAEHIQEILIDIFGIVSQSLLISVRDIDDYIYRDTYDHGICPLQTGFGSDHVGHVSDHDDNEQIYKKVQIYTDQIDIIKVLEGTQVIKDLLKQHKGDYGQGEGVDEKLIKRSSLKLLYKIDRHRTAEEIIRYQEDVSYELIDKKKIKKNTY